MSTRDKVLGAFAETPHQTLSGTELAKRLGQTRASVWKTIRSLKNDGLPLVSVPRAGYRFEESFDLSLFTLGQAPATWKPYQFHYRTQSPSTQLAAKAAAQQGARERQVWVSESQTSGRGRLDRAWASSWGGLWFSLLLRPKLPAARIPPSTLVAALSIRKAIAKVCGIDVRLKWPNDLVAKTDGRWKKCAGILTEMSGDMDRTDWMVLGVGLNVNNELPKTLQPIATSLRALSQTSWPRAFLLKEILSQFEKDFGQFQREGFASFVSAYWKAYSRPDELADFRTSREEFKATVRGVDGSGALIVESKGVRKTLTEGEIVL